MDNKEESDDLQPESELASSDDSTEILSEPRPARPGEGKEGAPLRRERGVTGQRAGFFARTSQFLNDVRAEMKRVSWPTAADVRNTTIIVVIAVIFFAVYLFLIDRGVAFLITRLDSLLKWITGAS